MGAVRTLGEAWEEGGGGVSAVSELLALKL
jgi:hypothetical protein